MKWTIKLIAESGSGERTEEVVATFEREDLLSPATVGLSIAEGKVILECSASVENGESVPPLR